MSINIFWFRRDLRLHDNAGLYHALKSGKPVLPIFIFDRNILDDLENKQDARVEFIHNTLSGVKNELENKGSSIHIYYGEPIKLWEKILSEYEIEAVYTNHDYEPYAIDRDNKIKELLESRNIRFHTYKDHLIFEKQEVLKDDGKPYTVFTPYSRKWMAKLNSKTIKYDTGEGENDLSYYLKPYPTEQYFQYFHHTAPLPFPSLSEMGFSPSNITFPTTEVTRGLIRNYDKTRDYPSINGTSRLGIHFRFGTVSIREKARNALGLNQTFLNELIWRDFYAQILAHFPHVVGHPFREQYDRIPWRDAPEDFEKWCLGRTGYPLVDAGMRELNATGYMHNRVRMVVASFLSKHLLLDWRWGEAYFAQKLLDFDLASNNGGWQWAAGCGTDAAPYFRVFNPAEQLKKFDSEYKYVRKWVPEFGTPSYPRPMVEHVFARERCLAAYKNALKDSAP